MDRNADAIAEILRVEYGITTMEQLHQAIAKLGRIDISPFCAKPKPGGGSRYDDKNTES